MSEEEKTGETQGTDAEAAAAEASESEASAAPSEAPEPAAEGEAAPEELDPKARRKLARSRSSGPARPARDPGERAGERAERRRAAKERRRRHRAAWRSKRGEPGTGTPAAEREPGSRKVRQGTVVSAAANKTITVEIAVARRHPTYEKVVRRTSKLHAHDEGNDAHEGDVVRLIEARPLSRAKRWRLLEVVERARGGEAQ